MFIRQKQVMIIELRNLQKSILGLFFSFIFPIISMYFVVVSVDSAYRTEAINAYYVTSLALGLAPLALLTFPASICKEYENGVFLRYKLFGIDNNMVILSKILLYFMLLVFQIIVITLFAKFMFDLSIPEFNISLKFYALYFFTSIPMFLIGALLTIILRRNMMVQSIGLLLMFIFLILSNAMMPVKNMPAFVDKLKYIIPTNDIVETLGLVWNGSMVSIAYFVKYVIYSIILLILIKVAFKKVKL